MLLPLKEDQLLIVCHELEIRTLDELERPALVMAPPPAPSPAHTHGNTHTQGGRIPEGPLWSLEQLQ